jgi:cyanophycinase-like exopeptidase
VEIPDETAAKWVKSGLAEVAGKGSVTKVTTDKQEKKKEQTRARVQRYREKKKSSVTTLSSVTEAKDNAV